MGGSARRFVRSGWSRAARSIAPLVVVLGLSGCRLEPADLQEGSTGDREAIGAQSTVPYSEAVRVGATYYFSGKVGATDSTRTIEEGRTAAETRNILEAFRDTFGRLGLDFADVVSANVYLTDITGYAEMNQVYAEYFSENPPARTTVAVMALPGGAAVEIAFVAVRP